MFPLAMIVLAAAAGLAALVVAMTMAAIRADHWIGIQGPMATRDALDSQIAIKRATISDLDAELERIRKALVDLAKVQAEVDALERRRSELLAEYKQLESREQEIVAIRNETEKEWSLHANAVQEFRKVDAQLSEVREEYESARRCLKMHEDAKNAYEDLQRKLEMARGELGKLEALRGQEEALQRKVGALKNEALRLEGEAGALRQKRDDADLAAKVATENAERRKQQQLEIIADVSAVRKERDGLREDLASLRASWAELERRIQELQEQLQGHKDHLEAIHEVAKLKKQNAELEGKNRDLVKKAKGIIAKLKRKIEDLKQKGVGKPPGRGNPLAELLDPPNFLRPGKEIAKPGQGREDELAVLEQVEDRFHKLGLIYPRRILRAFHTAMKVNDTSQMTVLAGVSGTGKSQLPRRYAEAMGMAFLQVPVQPRWDSPQDLMGFYNHVAERYHPTDMARALFHMDEFNGPHGSSELRKRMLLILLDEMNLARIEYYFSDFLSRLECRPSGDEVGNDALRKDSEVEIEIPVVVGEQRPRIFPGYNVLFAGTMNEDESTQALSDKVIDRSNIIQFSAPTKIFSHDPAVAERGPPAELSGTLSREVWQGWRKTQSASVDQEAREALDGISDLMRDEFRRPVGYRLGSAIMSYVVNYPDPAQDWRIAVADQVEMRILPKLRGVDVSDMALGFDKLGRLVNETLGDENLADAITNSVDQSKDLGLFSYAGSSRLEAL